MWKGKSIYRRHAQLDPVGESLVRGECAGVLDVLIGGVLVVPQFTLYGDARHGRRPEFTAAARPEVAEPLFERFCTVLAGQANGADITTIEGMAKGDKLHPVQQAFTECHALQCGFCTPGFITTAHALLTEEPDCDADRIREVLSGNICRCTGYIGIVDAVLEARAAYKKPAP